MTVGASGRGWRRAVEAVLSNQRRPASCATNTRSFPMRTRFGHAGKNRVTSSSQSPWRTRKVGIQADVHVAEREPADFRHHRSLIVVPTSPQDAAATFE